MNTIFCLLISGPAILVGIVFEYLALGFGAGREITRIMVDKS